jgi:hypothetical protein
LRALWPKEGRKILLFLKKKKQKDFSFLGAALDAEDGRKRMESFLVLFFKKEPLACLQTGMAAEAAPLRLPPCTDRRQGLQAFGDMGDT